MEESFEPKMLAFLCNWCSYAGADLAGVSRFQYPSSIRILRTMCSGRADPLHMIEALKSGFDSVLVFGCHPGDCHYLEGNHYALGRVEVLRQLLASSGIGADRLHIRWVSAAEGQIFADCVKELTEVTRELGPFDPGKFETELAAVESVMGSPRLRWLLGMDRHLTQRENVFHEKIAEEKYRKMLAGTAEVEYHKALILEALKKEPLSVREISSATGLAIHTVSLRLGELEKCGRADLHGYENTTPRFNRVAM